LVLIAVSASVYEDDQHQALMAGFDDFLAKPVKEQAVFRSLRRLLGLDWIREADSLQTNVSSASLEEAARAPLNEPVPSPEVLESLLGAAKHGDIMALRARVDGLSDPSLGRFRQRLQTLVGSFRMSEVEQVLQTARQKNS
jgi:CheY-like chemotaxis protein